MQVIDLENPVKDIPSPGKSNDRTLRLKFAIGFCLFLFLVQLIGGFVSHSLALLADAFHMLSDVLGYSISLISINLATRTKTASYSFGMKRVEVIGALMSIFLVWILSIGLVAEAHERLQNPKPINGRAMLIMAIGGVIVNGILIFVFGSDLEQTNTSELDEIDLESGIDLNKKSVLHHDDTSTKPEIEFKSENDVEMQIESASLVTTGSDDTACATTELASHTRTDLNIRAAMLHAIGDLLCSIGVLISSIIICVKPESIWIDPFCTFVFAVVAIFTTIPVTMDITKVLLQGNCPTFVLMNNAHLRNSFFYKPGPSGKRFAIDSKRFSNQRLARVAINPKRFGFFCGFTIRYYIDANSQELHYRCQKCVSRTSYCGMYS